MPLISLIVLLMAKDSKKPFVSEIGQLVGRCIEDSMLGFRSSSQHLGWSANLRIRTVKSLSFLEHYGLVSIPNKNSRICVTPLGRRVIDKALTGDNDLSYNLHQLSRSYRNICKIKQLDMALK